MKFSHSLQFNSVPEWTEHYIAYSNLKKIVYVLEKEIVETKRLQRLSQISDVTILEEGGPAVSTNQQFETALMKELERIDAFYHKAESSLLMEAEAFFIAYDNAVELDKKFANNKQLQESQSSPYLNKFHPQLQHKPSTSSLSSNNSNFMYQQPTLATLSPTIEEEENQEVVHPHHYKTLDPTSDNLGGSKDPSTLPNTPTPRRNWLINRAIDVYTTLSQLKSYITLNFTGFSKILKKYDKVTNSLFRDIFLKSHVQVSYPFLETTMSLLEEKINRTLLIFANLQTGGDIFVASDELAKYLREQVVWERNTVWRDMISQERKVAAAGTVKTTLHQALEEVRSEVLHGPTVSKRLPDWCDHILNKRFLCFSICLLEFFLLTSNQFMATKEQQNCLAILVLASTMWATEVVPLFVTSMFIPFLVVTLRVCRTQPTDPNVEPVVLPARDAARFIFSSMFSPVIMLVLGGFSLAAALSKYNVARRISSAILSRAGTCPKRILWANMCVSAGLSMVVTNVAAPVLCFSLIQPILRTLPSDNKYSGTLILGIALAANVGGLLTPIASPQSLVTLSYLDPQPSWLVWMAVSVPIGIVSTVAVFLLLLFTCPPSPDTVILPLRKMDDPVSLTEVYVMVVSAITILLWCCESFLDKIVGDIGVLAIFPLVMFFGTGILTKEDFNNFLWTVIMLAMGGIALGKAVATSGLLSEIAEIIKAQIDNFSLYMILVVFSVLILVATTFISHTVGALVILPVVLEVGKHLPTPHPQLLVLACGFMTSVGMGLPVSSFPNMNAVCLENEAGKCYLTTIDFMKAGIPASIVVWGICLTVGYTLLIVLGVQ